MNFLVAYTFKWEYEFGGLQREWFVPGLSRVSRLAPAGRAQYTTGNALFVKAPMFAQHSSFTWAIRAGFWEGVVEEVACHTSGNDSSCTL